MTEQFVPYEIALTLKEKGFDEPCFATYNHEQKLDGLPLYDMENNPTNALEYTWINSKVHNSICCAPLWQQVIDWLREKHSLDIMTRQIQLDGRAYYKISKIETEDKIKGYSNFCKSPYGAREKAIEQTLTLI
jgi:hypothetical protein